MADRDLLTRERRVPAPRPVARWVAVPKVGGGVELVMRWAVPEPALPVAPPYALAG